MAQSNAQQQNQTQKKSSSEQSGLKAPPTEKPPIPPPPGNGPSGEPNEWVKIPGTDGSKYGPQFKPKYPVPSPDGRQPRAWWDAEDGHWSYESGKPGDQRRHFDRWGTQINAQAVAKAATVVGTAVVIYRVWRVVQIVLEGAALLAAF